MSTLKATAVDGGELVLKRHDVDKPQAGFVKASSCPETRGTTRPGGCGTG